VSEFAIAIRCVRSDRRSNPTFVPDFPSPCSLAREPCREAVSSGYSTPPICVLMILSALTITSFGAINS